MENLQKLNKEIINCHLCPRLVAWRELVAATKRKAYLKQPYWGKPVPGFGDIDGKIMALGLAPGAHGSNRSGRMFTGDASGDFLYPALYRAGFSNQPNSTSVEDDLSLKDIFITAVCRCAPPENKPKKEEIINCTRYLESEFRMMGNLIGIVALGRIAFDSAINLIEHQYGKTFSNRPLFGHNKFYKPENNQFPWLLASYHPSRQNTQTGRLNMDMFDQIWKFSRKLIDDNIKKPGECSPG